MCLFACLAMAGLSHAEYTTPGLGSTYTAEDLASMSGGALLGSWPDYTQHEDIIIHAEDTLQLLPGTIWEAAAFVSLSIEGELHAEGEPWNAICFRSQAGTPGSWDGVTVDEGYALLQFTELRDAEDGINFLYGDGLLQYCTMRANQDSGVHCLGSSPTLIGCSIHENREYGVELTISSSPVLQHCVIRDNNLDNSSPLNAVAIGIQGTNSPVLSDCLIEGSGSSNQASCFSHWMSGDPVLRNCEITEGRSGVVIQGAGAIGHLEHCWVHNNHYSNPNLGGSGINVNTACTPVIRGCCIEENDWGVTVTASCQPDFGTSADSGGNRIHENGSMAGADFWNNTTGSISAVGNWWGTAVESEIEEGINDDGDGAFGNVSVSPWLEDDSSFAPFFKQDLGWTWITSGASLEIDPAEHFRSEDELNFELSGPGDFVSIEDVIQWTPPAGASEAEILLTATNQMGHSATDTLRVFIEQTPPEAPQLRLTVIAADVLLAWEPLPQAEAYHVYRSLSPYGDWQALGTTVETNWLDEHAMHATQYYYRITAEVPEN